MTNSVEVTRRDAPAGVPGRSAQQHFWNEWNDKYRGRGHEAHLDAATAQRRETVLSWVRELNLAQPRILDVGCATGWLTAQLTEFGEASGTDIADDSIRQARDWYPHIPFDCADFSTAKYPTGAFDIVVSLET
ncbi:MAG: class I SAM-dependent methyltransferase, partial [Gemmatimonadaceae bacterium]